MALLRQPCKKGKEQCQKRPKRSQLLLALQVLGAAMLVGRVVVLHGGGGYQSKLPVQGMSLALHHEAQTSDMHLPGAKPYNALAVTVTGSAAAPHPPACSVDEPLSKPKEQGLSQSLSRSLPVCCRALAPGRCRQKLTFTRELLRLLVSWMMGRPTQGAGHQRDHQQPQQ